MPFVVYAVKLYHAPSDSSLSVSIPDNVPLKLHLPPFHLDYPPPPPSLYPGSLNIGELGELGCVWLAAIVAAAAIHCETNFVLLSRGECPGLMVARCVWLLSTLCCDRIVGEQVAEPLAINH